MALNSSGPISIGGSTSGQSINLELGRSASASSNLNESALRTLAGKSSGAISLSDFYGKSNKTIINLTISSNTTDYNIRTAAGSPATASIVTVTINTGIIVGASAAGPYYFALDTGSGWAAGTELYLVNNGYIYGKGGAGNSNNASSAIKLNWNLTITNANGYIFGGGGGGAQGYGHGTPGIGYAGGGGGGGGQGYAGSAGGAPNNNGGEPGTAGDAGAMGYPGSGGAGGYNSVYGTTGGNGGDGGGWGENGKPSGANGAGAINNAIGYGGNAVVLNGYSVTWVNGNNGSRVKGAVS